MRAAVHTVLAGLLTTVFFAACRPAADEEPAIVVTAEPEFVVDLFEQRDPADGRPTFGLWVETVKAYDCPEDYRLQTNTTVTDASVNADFLDLTRVDPCNVTGAEQPVRQFVPLGSLNDRTYEFTLRVGTLLSNLGQLVVADQNYTLLMPGPNQGVDFRYRDLRSIPDQLIWGYVRTPGEASQGPADNLLADIKQVTGEPVLAPAYYGYFTVSGTNSLALHPSFAPSGQYRLFVRRLNVDPAALRGLLQQYRSAAQPLEIQCWSTWGEL